MEMTDEEKVKMLEKQVELLQRIVDLQKAAIPTYPVYIPYVQPQLIYPNIQPWNPWIITY
jgi:myosin-crossreactive antigen